MKKLLIVLGATALIVLVVTQISPIKNVRPAWIVPGKTEPLETGNTDGLNNKSETKEISVNGKQQTLTLPQEYSINVFAADLGSPRFMAVDSTGVLFVSIPKQGRVVALPDANNDGQADSVITVIDNLQYPHGLVFHKGFLYIAEENRISRVTINSNLLAGNREVIVDSLPFGGGETTGRGHRTRTIGFDKQNNMYLSVGSSCNVCEDKGRGMILRFNENGSNPQIFAQGLRNSVGLIFNPQTDEIWVTDNGRDLLGDDFPPDEINIVKKGAHYGWPYCNGDRIPDPDFGKNKPGFCQTTQPPHIPLQAHSAPLGLRFIGDNLYVAFHGSWNRSVPTGYKIVQIDPETKKVTDWLTGWLVKGKAWGRPVDIIDNGSGDIFITDDFAGVIYRIHLQVPSL